MVKNFIPFAIGISVAFLLYIFLPWWGFWVIFPWVGFSITTGLLLRRKLKGKKRILGRKVAILMILPCLLIFVPVVNRENFQLGGVALLVMVGFFSKGVIHYAVAKVFGPLIWGRGFCGWACWTAAVLDWLPVRKKKRPVPKKYKNLRFLMLFISLLVPAYLVFVLNYDVRSDFINQNEMLWMFAGNAVYYLLAIPAAFIFADRRFFCKYLCPVSLVMIPTSRLSLIKIQPTQNQCTECGACNKVCPMDVDVMSYIKKGKKITHPDCILCDDCMHVCPVGAIH